MAYNFAGSPDNYVDVNSSSLTATTDPVTLAAWFKPDLNTSRQTMVRLGSNAQGAFELCTLVSTNTNIGRVAAAKINQFGNSQSVSVATLPTVGDWNHAVAVFTGATVSSLPGPQNIYLNGNLATAASTQNLSATVTFSEVRIAARKTATPTTSVVAYYQGALAEVGIWNVKLDAKEIEALADGAKPISVRPSALMVYVPFVRDDDNDYTGNISLTASGSPAVVEHVRRYG